MREPSVPMTQPHIVQQLYQMLKDVHELFDVAQVEYWVAGGTLLGLVRHGGLIPWDDDLDVYCLTGQQAAIAALEPKLAALGYGLCTAWFGGFKVFLQDGRPIPLRNGTGVHPFRYPHLDIFLLELTDGQARYASPAARKRWRSHFHIYELYPLQQRPFGPLMVSSPCEPAPHLARLYGPSWGRVAARWYDHVLRQGVPRTEFTLNPSLLAPALPASPLQDRVAVPQLAVVSPRSPAGQPATVCLTMVVSPGGEEGLAASLLSVVALIDSWVVVARDGVDPVALQAEIDGIIAVQPGVLLCEQVEPVMAWDRALTVAFERCAYALVLEPGMVVLGAIPTVLSADEYTATTRRGDEALERSLLVSSRLDWTWISIRHGNLACSSVAPEEEACLTVAQNRTRVRLAATAVVPCHTGIPPRSLL